MSGVRCQAGAVHHQTKCITGNLKGLAIFVYRLNSASRGQDVGYNLTALFNPYMAQAKSNNSKATPIGLRWDGWSELAMTLLRPTNKPKAADHQTLIDYLKRQKAELQNYFVP